MTTVTTGYCSIMTNGPEEATTADSAAEAWMEDATEDIVAPPAEPDEDGPDAPTVDSGGGPQEGAADDRD